MDTFGDLVGWLYSKATFVLDLNPRCPYLQDLCKRDFGLYAHEPRIGRRRNRIFQDNEFIILCNGEGNFMVWDFRGDASFHSNLSTTLPV